MTEDEARAALDAYDGVGGLECWIAAQRWERVSGGWTVPGELQGWRFRVVASADGGEPAAWFVPGA